MRARLARPRRIVRGRLVAPVAAAAAVALVGGVVVATPDAPTVREDVRTVAVTIPGFQVDAQYSYDLNGIAWSGSMAGLEVTGVDELPDGLTYENGVISGTPTKSGVFDLTVKGTMNGEAVELPVQLAVFNADGTAPAGFNAGSSGAVQGSLGGEAQAEGQIVTGSEGADAILGAVSSIVVALGGDAGSVGDLVTGSTGGTETPDNESPAPGSLGSSTTGEATGEAGGELNTESLGPLGSLIDTGTETETNTGSGSNTEAETAGGGEVSVPGSSVPGSSTTGTTGSLGNLAPGLALTGAALLGLAGLSIVLNGGSSTPGATSSLPSLPGSSTTTEGGSSGSNGSSGNRPGGSSGSVAPTVAAGSPERAQAPGPTVANGRG
ncbi:hypothetical protein G6016_11865 [Dietzia aerolata]|uniref:Uncharacterized protein n=1 Tax=Dietzia aerolata TaxID=595984 RepID=A0ABV5JP11_9ACTN|nr:hypothetical protein [Dietzia aerolata]MBB0969639.1 hypothetical protein [Dietzia aerolata]